MERFCEVASWIAGKCGNKLLDFKGFGWKCGV